MSNGTTSTSRMVELDAMRGLAALAVAVFHYTTHFGHEVGHIVPPRFGFPAGNYGVQLFFLISGFVIFMTLERSRTAADFAVSRFSRLFPAYWASILVTAAVVHSIGLPSQHLSNHDLLLNLTMVQEILGAEHLDGSYWTLQVELFFYVQMLFWYATGQLRRIQWIIVAWLIIALVLGVTAKLGGHVSYSLRELLIARHIPFFALGVLFYRYYTYPLERRSSVVLIVAALVTIAVALPIQLTPVALVCAALFALFVTGRLRWLRLAPFAWLGAISYSVYLLHQVIGFDLLWQLEHHGIDGGPAALITLVVMLGLASLLTYSVERPAMRLIRRLWNRRRGMETLTATPPRT